MSLRDTEIFYKINIIFLLIIFCYFDDSCTVLLVVTAQKSVFKSVFATLRILNLYCGDRIKVRLLKTFLIPSHFIVNMTTISM